MTSEMLIVASTTIVGSTTTSIMAAVVACVWSGTSEASRSSTRFASRMDVVVSGSHRELRKVSDSRLAGNEFLIAFPLIGTMLDLPYHQFTGTVQVMKAVGNHLVLTFCETLPKSQIFTIILTRKPHLLSRDVRQASCSINSD